MLDMNNVMMVMIFHMMGVFSVNFNVKMNARIVLREFVRNAIPKVGFYKNKLVLHIVGMELLYHHMKYVTMEIVNHSMDVLIVITNVKRSVENAMKADVIDVMN